MSFLTQPITLRSLFGTKRQFGSIEVQVVLNEITSDILTITKQPIQQGASITDHAYKEPTTVSMQLRFQDNLFVSLSKIYKDLLDLQNSRTPIEVITLKRIYSNMLIASLGLTTDKQTENCLAISITFQEIIIVPVATIIPRAVQKNPGATGATQPAGKKQAQSAIRTGAGGRTFGSLFQ